MEENRKFGLVEKYSLLLADSFCVILCYPLAYWLRFRKFDGVFHELFLVMFILIFLGNLLYLLITNSNNHFFTRGFLKEAIQVCYKNIVMFVIVGVFVYSFRFEKDFSRLFLGYYVILNTVVSWAVRMLTKNYFLRDFKSGVKGDRVLVVTSSSQLERLARHEARTDHWSYKIVGICLTDCDRVGDVLDGDIPVVANKKSVTTALSDMVIDVVFISHPELTEDELSDLINEITLAGITCHYNTELPIRIGSKPTAGRFADFPVITYATVDYDWRKRILKRLADIAGSIVGLLFTAILFPFIAIAIKIDSPGPIFFAQTRVSKNGREFKFYKFRSMYRDAEARKAELMDQNEMNGPIFKMENDPRITKVGKFLRKTSLDELPQFWNVLMADMSLVGVRPPTLQEYQQYNAYQRRRLSVRPGITGLWQVSGRNEISDFEEIVKLDFEYIDEWSPSLDIKILFMTIGAIFGKSGR